MALELYPVSGTGLYRDRHDRFYIGPLTPVIGSASEVYYTRIDNGLKTPLTQVEVIKSDDEPAPDAIDAEVVATCAAPGCNTPLNRKQIERNGVYCSRACSNKAGGK